MHESGHEIASHSYEHVDLSAQTIDLVNAQEYAMLSNELATNTGVARPYFENPAALGPGVCGPSSLRFKNAAGAGRSKLPRVRIVSTSPAVALRGSFWPGRSARPASSSSAPIRP